MFSTLKLGVAVLAGVMLLICQIGICTNATAGHNPQHSCCPSGSGAQDAPSNPACLAANVPAPESGLDHDPIFDAAGVTPIHVAGIDLIVSWSANKPRVLHLPQDRAIIFHQILV